MTLLYIEDLNVYFRVADDRFHAVKGFSLDMGPDDRICLVGESGSGKSVVASAIFGVLERNASYEGRIIFKGQDLSALSEKEFDGIRRKELVLIPQNVSQAWDPLLKIGPQMLEFIEASGYSEKESKERAISFLSRCGFDDPESIMDTYPHRLSGGMSQRAMIAMCMSVEPSMVVADEPTKGLDEEVCDSVLDLLFDNDWKTAILMITHDLRSASRGNRIMVMYGGRCVESGATQDILDNPLHPYTKGLLESDPSRGLKPIPFATRDLRPGECAFGNRCPYSEDGCSNDLFEVEGREVRCHRARDA